MKKGPSEDTDELQQTGTDEHQRTWQNVEENPNQTLEDGRVPAKEAKKWKIEGQKEKSRERSISERKILRERGELPKEEGDAVRGYKAMHEETFFGSWLREGKLVRRMKQKGVKREKEKWRTKKTSVWAFDKTKEAFELVAKNETEKRSIVQEIMLRSTDCLRRIIAPVGGQRGVTMSYLCRIATVSQWKTTSGGSQGEKAQQLVVRDLWKIRLEATRDRLLVAQAYESINQAKLFNAHAVRQGLCGKLVNAVKLLAMETTSYGTS